MHWIDRLPRREWVEISFFGGRKFIVATDEDGPTMHEVFRDDPVGTLRYHNTLLGIERRWRALMENQ